ncbi:MAG TPA: hypothetical protein VLJ37_08865 [bacterium]|nr:hypothetical protein [bacterium]
METVLRLVLTAFFVLSGAACLPQAVPTGAPAGGGVLGPANADVRSADGGAPDSGGGDVEEPGVEGPSPSGKFADASSGPRGSITYESVLSPMQAGDAVPTHDPTGNQLTLVTGEKTATCATPAGIQVVHLRGRAGMIIGFNIDPATIDAEQASKSLIVPMGTHLRLIYARGSDALYYKDLPFLSSPPRPEGKPGLVARAPVVDPQNSEPVVYFDTDVATSDADSLRFVAFGWYGYQPSPSPQSCQSLECTDGLDLHQPHKLLNRLADTTGPDPLPSCFEPKMEMMGR